MNTILIQKLKFSAIHLGISIMVIAGAAMIVTQLWYPGFYFYIDGGLEGLEIVFFVDVVLGPMLSFAVFKKGKKGLKLDLSLIFVLQISCFLWGLKQTYDERPLIVALVKDTFKTLNFAGMELNGIPMSILESIPGSYPKQVLVRLPDLKEKNLDEILKDLLKKGHFHAWYQYYQPLFSDIDFLQSFGYPSSSSAVQRKHTSNAQPHETKVLYFNISGKYDSGIVEVDLEAQRITGLQTSKDIEVPSGLKP